MPVFSVVLLCVPLWLLCAALSESIYGNVGQRSVIPSTLRARGARCGADGAVPVFTVGLRASFRESPSPQPTSSVLRSESERSRSPSKVSPPISCWRTNAPLAFYEDDHTPVVISLGTLLSWNCACSRTVGQPGILSLGIGPRRLGCIRPHLLLFAPHHSLAPWLYRPAHGRKQART